MPTRLPETDVVIVGMGAVGGVAALPLARARINVIRVEDGPFGLEELEAYYDKVEYEVGVSGQAGNIGGKIDSTGNIFEGPRKRGYPMPPLRWTGFLEKMAGAARSIGWHPFPGPAAIN